MLSLSKAIKNNHIINTIQKLRRESVFDNAFRITTFLLNVICFDLVLDWVAKPTPVTKIFQI
jgi:hypothetical protein